jgi:hypothetical protein
MYWREEAEKKEDKGEMEGRARTRFEHEQMRIGGLRGRGVIREGLIA